MSDLRVLPDPTPRNIRLLVWWLRLTGFRA